MSSPQKDDGSDTSMEVDYVISYRFADTDSITAVKQFQKLVHALSSVGLATEVRNGEKHSVLVFVKLASNEHLYGEVYRSRVKDWLHGVRAVVPDTETGQTLKSDPLYPAERLRIIYQLINNPVHEGGAGITPKQGEWENVESIFALHDPEFNKAWIKKWSTSYMLKPDDLDQIRDRFGEKIAFYFAFTQAYFTALIGIAIFGVSAWAILGYFSSIYGIINSFLCVAFVEYWKHQEHDLAIRWGVRGVSSIETKRIDYRFEKEVKDPLSGEVMHIFPAPKRLQRQLLQIPFALTAALVLGSLIATCFGIEIFMSEIYKGPGQSILVFLPTGILTAAQPLLLGYLTSLAERLTKYENYETNGAYETAMTQKMFVLNFIKSYLPIFLTAFVYVPFASSLVPYLDVFSLTVTPFAKDAKQTRAPPTGFHIDPSRLRKQVIYFTVTAQIVNAAMEVILPYVKKEGFSKYKQIRSNRAARHGGVTLQAAASDPPEETIFLRRVRSEAELDVYDVTTDFREMVVQYGYLALFSVVWPLTSVSFLVNNWIELRADAVKICMQSQRPTPWRADGIGPWLDSLEFLTWLGSLTTAALVYLFSNDGLGPDGTPADITGWALLLSIFLSEHIYLVVRWSVRKLVSKIDSPGRQRERAERYKIRKSYLQESLGEQPARVAPKAVREQISRNTLEEEARQGSRDTSRVVDRFWQRQRSWQETAQTGARLIEMAAPRESEKQQ